jgi:hypothetical protein
MVGVHAVDVAEAVTHHDGGHRHRQRRRGAQIEFTPCEHAGAGSAGHAGQRREVHVDQRGTGLRIHRRADHAHPARQASAAGGGDLGRGAGDDAAELGRGHLGPPFQPSLPDQAEQFRAAGHHGADGGGARRNDAAVGRVHMRLRQAHLLCLQQCPRGLGPGLRRFLGGEVLVDLRGAERAGALQRARPLGVVRGVGGRRLGLGQAGARLGHLRSQRVGRQRRQQLALAHSVADVHVHLRQAQAGGLDAHDGLLPGHDVAVGRERDRKARPLRQRRRHGQRRPDRGFGFRRAVCAEPPDQESGDGEHGHCDHKGEELLSCHGAFSVSASAGPGGAQPPPSARYSAIHAEIRSRCRLTRAVSAASAVRRDSSSSIRLARPLR